MKKIHVTGTLGKYIDWARVPDRLLVEASQRGQIVHAACGAFALGGYVKALPAAYAGYFTSFKRWYRANVKRCILAERTFVSREFGFTGRPDLVVELINGQNALVDLKTPIAESKVWAVQLSAYWYLLDKAGFQIDIAFSLRLRKRGTEALATPYKDWLSDFDIYLSALNAHRALVC